MNKKNHTVNEFVLTGFGDLQGFRHVFFCLCLLVYMTSLSGNILVILLVSTSYLLEMPMYFFLCHLSMSDMLLTTNIVPSLLEVIVHGRKVMVFGECLLQFQFFGGSTGTECLLLTVMSYDRYLAICDPLNYIPTMSARLTYHLVAGCWALGFSITLTVTLLISSLHFCGSNTLNHFFCDFAPILKLSCSDTRVLQITDFVLTAPVTVFPFVFIMGSYVFISRAIVRIPTHSGRQKAFSTCSAHLAVVCVFYLSLITIYMTPNTGRSAVANKALSLMYTVLAPSLNPLIYTLRNQEIRAVAGKCSFMRWKR